MWLSVLPAAVVALLGATAVLCVLVTSGETVTARMGWALVLAWIACVVVIAIAANRANAVDRLVVARIGAVRSSTTHRRAEVQWLIERLRRGERLESPAELVPGRGDDGFALLQRELDEVLHAAQVAVVEASAVTPAAPVPNSGHQVEVFVNLARRLQSLVHREIQLLDDLENQVEDPDLLKGLFQVDHLATRIRRHAENLAVLGGAVSRRQWSRPVALTEVLRSAMAEVQQYSRVKLVPPIEGTLGGHAVADVIHLVAELVENATNFSAPHTQVLLRAQAVTAGIAVEVEDRGLGMPLADQDRVNRLLVDPTGIDVGELLRDGRIGLFVVGAIARRHGITVRLQTNIYGGIQAVLILPPGLLGAPPQRSESWHEMQPQPQSMVQPPRHEPQFAMVASGSTPPPPAYSPAPAPPRVHDRTPMPSEGIRAEVTAQPSAAWDYLSSPTDSSASLPAASEAARYAGGTAAEGAAASDPTTSQFADGDARPQLPHRKPQTHLAPQLHGAPSAPVSVEQVAEHDPTLMATFTRAFSQGEAGTGGNDGSEGRLDGIS
ncbi:ATP-binding protein [Micromonospora sicca]|uniref:histidine kinase n=1 Tax=Micromonospora sicca TaxID=2202420 RepID=A0A317DM44_9ACTN|nr:ATP-binding protein [Micromonospora sp. 4G51]